MKIPVTFYEKILPTSQLGKLAVYSPRTVAQVYQIVNLGGELYVVSVYPMETIKASEQK